MYFFFNLHFNSSEKLSKLLDVTQLTEWSLYLLEEQGCGSEMGVEWGTGWVVLASPLSCHLSDLSWPKAWDSNLLFKPHVYSYPSSVPWETGSEGQYDPTVCGTGPLF